VAPFVYCADFLCFGICPALVWEVVVEYSQSDILSLRKSAFILDKCIHVLRGCPRLIRDPRAALMAGR